MIIVSRKMTAAAVLLTLLVAALCGMSSPALAQAPSQPLPEISPELDKRLKVLETELRCLVCQNQTLADSPAGLADDLRREIRTLALAGKDNAEIKEFLQTRYGDFILYRPPLKSSTWLLWVGPFGLLLLGIVVFGFVLRRRSTHALEEDATGSAMSRKLLDEDDRDSKR